MESSINFVKRCRLLNTLKDEFGTEVAKLSLQLVFAAVVSINKRMEAKFKKHPMVTKFFSKIPDADDIPDRRLYVEQADAVTTVSGRTLWGINLRAQYGSAYMDEVPTMTVDDWEDILKLILGFVDLEPEYDRLNANAKARQLKRNADRAAESPPKPPSALSYNETEKAIRTLYDRRHEFQANCCIHAAAIKDAFKKLKVCD